MPSILIYDLGIENLLYSHNLQVNTSFKEYFEENGFKTTLFNIERKTPKYSKFKLIRKLQEIIFSVKSLILNFKHLKNNQIYFMPSADFRNMVEICILVTFLKITRKNSLLLVRFLSIDTANYMKSSILKYSINIFFTFIKSMSVKIVFATETLEASENFKSMFRVESVFLPNPIRPVFGQTSSHSNHLLLIGKARKDKGLDELPVFCEQFWASNIDCVIEAQIPSSHSFFKNIDNLIALPEVVDQIHFYEILSKATWFFAPYSLEEFRIRGSMVITNALEHNKATLARKGTSIGNFIDKFSIGATFQDSNDIVDSFRKMINLDEENLKVNLDKARDYVLSNINEVREILERELSVR